MNGVPLIASAPVKHESPTNFQGYEVTKYQPPWSSFSDFATRMESDDCTQTPGFQHLVNQVCKKALKNLQKGLIKIFSRQLHGYDLSDNQTHYPEFDWHNKNRDSTDSYQESEESGSL